MLRKGACLALALFISALMALSFGCARLAPQAPPPDTAFKDRGSLTAGRFMFPQRWLVWPNPGGFKAVRPAPEQTFLFGWESPDLSAWLWLLEGTPELEQAGRQLAAARGWELGGERHISWRGLPCWEAVVSKGEGGGRLRVLRSLRGSLAAAVLSPEAPKDPVAGLLRRMEVLEGLRLAPLGDAVHVVRYTDETLSVIALWYTGSSGNWELIKRHNEMKDATLALGQELLIPAELVVRSSPLPSEFVFMAQPGLRRDFQEKRTRQGPERMELKKLPPAGPK